MDARGATALTVGDDLAGRNDAASRDGVAIHLHSPAVFLYLEDALDLSHTLRVTLPEGWDFASGQRPDPLQPGVFRSQPGAAPTEALRVISEGIPSGVPRPIRVPKPSR